MEDKGFLASLFDLSFSSFITLKLIKIIFVLMLIGAGLYTLVIIGTAFAADTVAGVLALVLSPVIFLFFAIMARVYLEVLIVVFRIADNTAAIANNTKAPGAPDTPGV